MYRYALQNTEQLYGDDRFLELMYKNSLTPHAKNLFEIELLETKRYFLDIPATRMIYVSVYNSELLYGGSEEGGWWYDGYSVEKSFRVRNQADLVQEKIAALEKEYPENPDYSSVLCGHTYIVFAEYRAGSFTTRQRPRYE